jgi:hypothetical protein
MHRLLASSGVVYRWATRIGPLGRWRPTQALLGLRTYLYLREQKDGIRHLLTMRILVTIMQVFSTSDTSTVRSLAVVGTGCGSVPPYYYDRPCSE